MLFVSVIFYRNGLLSQHVIWILCLENLVVCCGLGVLLYRLALMMPVKGSRWFGEGVGKRTLCMFCCHVDASCSLCAMIMCLLWFSILFLCYGVDGCWWK